MKLAQRIVGCRDPLLLQFLALGQLCPPISQLSLHWMDRVRYATHSFHSVRNGDNSEPFVPEYMFLWIIVVCSNIYMLLEKCGDEMG